MAGTLPQTPIFPLPGQLAALTRGFGAQQRAVEVAAAEARAKAISSSLDRRGENFRAIVGNIDDVQASIGGGATIAGLTNNLSDFGITLSPEQRATSDEFAERSGDLRQTKLFGEGLNEVGTGLGKLRGEAGFATNVPGALAAISGKAPENLRPVATNAELDIAAAAAGAFKFNDNLIEFFDTRTGQRLPNTRLYQNEKLGTAEALNSGVPREFISSRLVRAASNAPVVVEPVEAPANTPTPTPDPAVDPTEPASTEQPETAPIASPVAGTEEAEARARVAGQPPVNADGAVVTTITRPDGNYTITKNLDGSLVIAVPDGRTVPITAAKAAELGL